MEALAAQRSWSRTEALSSNVDGNWKSIEEKKRMKTSRRFGIEHITPVYISREFASVMLKPPPTFCRMEVLYRFSEWRTERFYCASTAKALGFTWCPIVMEYTASALLALFL